MFEMRTPSQSEDKDFFRGGQVSSSKRKKQLPEKQIRKYNWCNKRRRIVGKSSELSEGLQKKVGANISSSGCLWRNWGTEYS